MSSKCINCGKAFNPEAHTFHMYGFGPECVKKFLSGELLYQDLVRDGKSPFGVGFDDYVSKLSQQDQEIISALLTGEQWEEFRSAKYGIPKPLLREYLLRSSPTAQANVFGRIANLIHYVRVGFSKKDDPRTRDAYAEAGMQEVFEAYSSAFSRYRETFKDPNLPFASLLPRNSQERSLLVHKAFVNSLLDEIPQKKELGNYNLDTFDSASRYAFQLAKIGAGPDGAKSGIEGLVIQSAYDAMTDPNGENEFFCLSAYLNASTDTERYNSFPSPQILEGVVLTEAYLGTEQGDRTDNLRSVIENFRADLGEEGIENVLDMDRTMRVSQVTGEDIELGWEPIRASTGPDFMFHDHGVEITTRPAHVDGLPCFEEVGTPDVKFADSYLGKLKRGVTKVVHNDGEKRSSVLARSELRHILSGKKKINQNSIAPLALAVSARRSNDGHFANVIRVKNGVIDKVMPARSMDLKLNEENFSAAMKAHAALKKTFWTDDEFHKESEENGYEYFVATTGYSLFKEEYRTSFHYKPAKLSKDNTMCDPYNLIAKKLSVEAGLLTQVWTLDCMSTVHRDSKSNYKFASCDLQLSGDKPSKEDSEDMKKISSLAIRGAELEDSAQEFFNNYAPFGSAYQTGEVIAIQVRNAKRRLPPMGESLSLLKDIELTATGFASSDLHFDPASIVSGGDIVSRRKTENPRNVPGKNERKEKLRGYLESLFKSK